MIVYTIANFYTILWISVRPLRRLGKFINSYRKGVNGFHRKQQLSKDLTDTLDVHGGLKSLDFEMLIDLLAEKMGLEIALRILATVDSEFREDWSATLRDHVTFLTQ